MLNFNDFLLTTQGNMLPALVDDLAADLGVTADSIRRLGVGYYPAEGCWIFPERDGEGNVIGLLRRFPNGRKFLVTGGKRGLYYECRAVQGLLTQRPQFVRVGDAGVECPICHRENDGCLVSDDNPADPACVICVRTAEGAERQLETGAGYLHRRHPQLNRKGDSLSVLPVSDQPVVVTEGASDCLAAMSLGYVAVGRASANDVGKALPGLLQGREVILVGDRDPHGVGQRSLETTFQALRSVVQSIVKVLPPEGKGKDLRQWLNAGLTRVEFEEYVRAAGVTTDAQSVLNDCAPLALIRTWLQAEHMKDGVQLFHYINGDYYRWEGNVYKRMSPEEVRCEWYTFFTDKQVKVQAGKDVKLITLHPDRKFMGNLHDAASAYCHIRVEDGVHEPFLIKAHAPMDLARAVVFRNGILYVTDDRLSPLTPDVFLTSTLPYDYNPHHQCALWRWFVTDVFEGDQECIDLLQEWFGYNLIASNHMQSMMFFFGVPGSGKSTMAEILTSLLGPARCCGANTSNFRSLFGGESLLNKYAAIMSESRDTAKKDIDQLLQTWKALTGGDLMNIARKYKSAVDTRLFCRLTYVANEAIPFDDSPQAMVDRMNLLYFGKNYRKGKPDRELPEKLKKELPGIALWAIEGLKRLLANNRFTLPKRSKDQLARIADLTNPIGAMLNECVERFEIGTPEYFANRVPCSQLYDLWKGWCTYNMSHTSLSATGFGMKLSHLESPLKSTQIMEGGKRMYVYKGIAIRQESADRYLK